MSKETNKKIILYLINELGNNVEGKKKLMKLMFLINYYDIDNEKLISKSKLGDDFCIYYYGVFSYNIMDCINELIKSKEITDGFPLRTKQCVELKNGLKHIVDKIIQYFGKDSGYKLEIGTLNMIGIQPDEKRKYFGIKVSDLIKD